MMPFCLLFHALLHFESLFATLAQKANGQVGAQFHRSELNFMNFVGQSDGEFR